MGVPLPPGINEQQWQQGLAFFEMFLKKVEVTREGKKVSVNWIFEFPDEEMAKLFVKTSQQQLEQMRKKD